MPEININGPEGRIEARYHHQADAEAPCAVILHSHPQFFGTLNHQIVYDMYYSFVRRGFSVARFNFRGVGRSDGSFDNGPGELADAATVLDWVQSHNPDSKRYWIGGVSFGAWIAMQLLMRRPEIEGFVSVAPQAGLYDFNFLAPCPSSGIVISGEIDRVVKPEALGELVEKLQSQGNINVEHVQVQGANHFFENKIPELMAEVEHYLDQRLGAGQ
jgi:alpha/beta superfamily hydrolase